MNNAKLPPTHLKFSVIPIKKTGYKSKLLLVHHHKLHLPYWLLNKYSIFDFCKIKGIEENICSQVNVYTNQY